MEKLHEWCKHYQRESVLEGSQKILKESILHTFITLRRVTANISSEKPIFSTIFSVNALSDHLPHNFADLDDLDPMSSCYDMLCHGEDVEQLHVCT